MNFDRIFKIFDTVVSVLDAKKEEPPKQAPPQDRQTPATTFADQIEMRLTNVVGVSCITNLAAGVSNRPIDHSQVMAIGERVRGDFTELLKRVIPRFV